MSEDNNNNVKENGFFDRPDPLERYTPDGKVFPNMKEKKAGGGPGGCLLIFLLVVLIPTLCYFLTRIPRMYRERQEEKQTKEEMTFNLTGWRRIISPESSGTVCLS